MSVIYDTLDKLKSNWLEIKADAVNQHKINQKEMDFKVLSSNLSSIEAHILINSYKI